MRVPVCAEQGLAPREIRSQRDKGEKPKEKDTRGTREELSQTKQRRRRQITKKGRRPGGRGVHAGTPTKTKLEKGTTWPPDALPFRTIEGRCPTVGTGRKTHGKKGGGRANKGKKKTEGKKCRAQDFPFGFNATEGRKKKKNLLGESQEETEREKSKPEGRGKKFRKGGLSRDVAEQPPAPVASIREAQKPRTT